MTRPRARGDKEHHGNKNCLACYSGSENRTLESTMDLQCRERKVHQVLLAKSGLDVSGRCVM